MPAFDDIHALADGRLSAWTGLPDLAITDLIAWLGAPAGTDEAPLGHGPALRHAFPLAGSGRTLHAWERDGRIVMLDVEPCPPIGALAGLPEPTAILPQEVRIDGAYAHEYFFAQRGLLLTIARPLHGTAPDRLVRCRGIRPLPASARTPGPELYWPLASRIRW